MHGKNKGIIMVCTRYDPPGLHDDFLFIVERSKLNDIEICAYLDVSASTLRRWLTDNSAPLMARRLMVLVQGDLGSLWPEWKGWRFCGDDLWTPEDVPYCSGEIQAIFWRQQQIRGLKIDLREEKKKTELLTRPSAEIIPFNRTS